MTITQDDRPASGCCAPSPCSAFRVLVACEYSGTVRDAFAALGHDAMSCDLLPSEKPGKHYQGDVRDVLDAGWDIMICVNRVDMCGLKVNHDHMQYAPIKNFQAYRVSDAGWIETKWRTGNFYNGFVRPNETWKRMKHNERPDGTDLEASVGRMCISWLPRRSLGRSRSKARWLGIKTESPAITQLPTSNGERTWKTKWTRKSTGRGTVGMAANLQMNRGSRYGLVR